MKYFVGYLIEGEAAEWHKGVAQKISEKFGTWEIHKKVPPHITLFRPFELTDLTPVKTLLTDWSTHTKIPGTLTLSGFGRFSNRVVFVNVVAEPQIVTPVQELREKLAHIPSMTPEDFSKWLPHATLAHKVTSDEIEKIWSFVQTLRSPHFALHFNNVSLFRSNGDRDWFVEQTYPL